MDSNEYWKLLRRPEWRRFRERVLEARGCVCECCGAEGSLEIHHLAYRPGRLPWEYGLDEVRVYCPVCHQERHRMEGLVVERGGMSDLPAEELCPRCGGEGFYPPESGRILGGRCLRCMGSGREGYADMSLESAWCLAGEIWSGLMEEECPAPFVDRDAVFDWVAGIQGFSEEERKGFLEERHRKR